MKIGELAKITGCQVGTIRFYETSGLLPAAPRTQGNYRVYGEEHKKSLQFILHCRALDLSIDEVKELINLKSAQASDARKAHSIIENHILEINKKITQLESLKSELEFLAHKCGHDHREEKGETCCLIEALHQ